MRAFNCALLEMAIYADFHHNLAFFAKLKGPLGNEIRISNQTLVSLTYEIAFLPQHRKPFLTLFDSLFIVFHRLFTSPGPFFVPFLTPGATIIGDMESIFTIICNIESFIKCLPMPFHANPLTNPI